MENILLKINSWLVYIIPIMVMITAYTAHRLASLAISMIEYSRLSRLEDSLS